MRLEKNMTRVTSESHILLVYSFSELSSSSSVKLGVLRIVGLVKLNSWAKLVFVLLPNESQFLSKTSPSPSSTGSVRLASIHRSSDTERGERSLEVHSLSMYYTVTQFAWFTQFRKYSSERVNQYSIEGVN